MPVYFRTRIGPVTVSKRLEASKEKRPILPVLIGAGLAFLMFALCIGTQR
jgi:hypothetical protein